MLTLKVNMLAACYFNTHRVQVPQLDKHILPGPLCCSSLVAHIRCKVYETGNSTHSAHITHNINNNTHNIKPK